MGIKFSQFINAFDIFDDDYLVGVQTGANKRFTMLRLLQWFKSKIASSDISYDPTISGASATNVKDALDEAFSDLGDKQASITASGILKGDGQGGVTSATAGTDYQTPLTAGTDYATPAQLADKAAKADLTSIQATGTTNTTGAAIPVGAYFYLNGILFQAKTLIGQNDLFTPGTNCKQVTLGEEIATKGEGNTKYTQYFPSAATTITHTFSDACQWMMITERDTSSPPQSNGLYFGYNSAAQAARCTVNTVFTPASNPVTISPDVNKLVLTTHTGYVRITIIEFYRTVYG